MIIAFLNQNALIQRETATALLRLQGVKLVTLDVATHPSPEQVESICRVLIEHHCSMVFTINEWGIDDQGIFSAFCTSKHILHVNWSVDDPFYEEIMLNKKFREHQFRIDFVSDKGYLAPMQKCGYHVHFLPLATDPSLFSPDPAPDKLFTHDIVFVGNSYTKQMDSFLKIAPDFIEVLTPFIGKIVKKYLDDMAFDVEAAIEENLTKRRLPQPLTLEKASYIAKHAAGYFARKKMVAALVSKFTNFKVYGEPGWLLELPKERVGTAKYYDTLCAVYRSSKITIDINRMVIRNGFTQRAFDAPASGSFLLTSAKKVVAETFVISGKQQEIAVFDSMDSLEHNIQYYLGHEDERRAIACRGSSKVLAEHTYDHRIAEMFRTIAVFMNSTTPFNQKQEDKSCSQVPA